MLLRMTQRLQIFDGVGISRGNDVVVHQFRIVLEDFQMKPEIIAVCPF